MHAEQLDVSVDTVERLVREQFPQWADLRVTTVASHGTVNHVFRIGPDLSARFPLVAADPAETRQQLEGQAAAGRQLSGRTRFPTPHPVAVGSPGDGYPMPWAVQTWVPGTDATRHDPAESRGFAADLAEFVTDVHALDTAGRDFGGAGRGGTLATHDAWMQECLHRSEGLLATDVLRPMWGSMRSLPRGDRHDVMSHGDLTPGNVLVSADRLAGVIDIDGLGPADPALDLLCAWHLLDDEPRLVLRDALGCDDAMWARGRAWAFEQAMGLVWYYATTNPTMSAIGRRTLQRIMADQTPPVGPSG